MTKNQDKIDQVINHISHLPFGCSEWKNSLMKLKKEELIDLIELVVSYKKHTIAFDYQFSLN